jgi:hypothetical protein
MFRMNLFQLLPTGGTDLHETLGAAQLAFVGIELGA